MKYLAKSRGLGAFIVVNGFKRGLRGHIALEAALSNAVADKGHGYGLGAPLIRLLLL